MGPVLRLQRQCLHRHVASLAPPHDKRGGFFVARMGGEGLPVAIELAAVYVPVIPSLKGTAATIQRELGGVDVAGVGKKLGGSLGSTIADGVGAVGRIGATITATVGAAVAGIALKGGIDRALAIEEAQAKLSGLGHSASSVSQIMADALSAVKGTAFGLGEAATIAASAVAAGVAPGQDLARYLKITADTASIAGQSLGDLGSVMNNVTTLGSAYNDSLQILAQKGLPIYQWLSEAMRVSTAEVKQLASEGKVSSEVFLAAIERNVSGAALAAGSTFTGALANVRAALGRVGAAAASPVLNGLRDTFNALIPVVDKVAASLAPLFETFAGKVAAAAPVVIAAFAAMGDGIAGLASGGLGQLGPIFAALGPILAGAIAPLLAGLPVIGKLFAGLTPQFGIIVGLVAALLAASPELRAALGELGGAFLSLLQGVMPQITAILGAVLGLFPILGGALAAVVSAVAGAVTWLSQFGDVLVPLAIGVAAGVVAFKLWTGAIAAWRAATIAATAVQAAFNLVMNANPIMLIITAIAALVAGLVYFFTQTELGKAIWAEFTRFLGEAWTNIVNVATTVFTALGDFFSGVWNGIVTAVTTAWNAIVAFLTPVFNFIGALISTYIQIYVNIFMVFAAVLITIWNAIVNVVTTVWNAIVGFLTPIITWIVDFIVGYFTTLWNFWSGVWNAISSFFTGLWNGMVSFVTGVVLQVIQAVMGPVQALSAWWAGIWNSISSFFSGIWDGMVGAVGNAIGAIGNVVGTIFDRVMSAFGDIGTWLLDSGAALIQGFIDGITGMIGAVGDAVGGVIDWARGFFPNSPAKRGPLSGSGWVKLRHSGAAVMEQWGLGFGDAGALEASLATTFSAPDVPGSLSRSAAVSSGRADAGGLPKELVIVDADRQLIGRMQVEADGRVSSYARAEDTKWSSGGKSL